MTNATTTAPEAPATATEVDAAVAAQAAAPEASESKPEEAPQAAEKPSSEEGEAGETAAAEPDLLGGDPAEKPEETKAEGEDAAEGAEPATYELQAPEGAPFAEGALEEIAEFAGEIGLTQEQAQAVTNRYAKVLGDAQGQLKATYEGFRKEIREDKTWGGSKEKQEQTAAYFAQAVDAVAPGFRQSLRDNEAMLEPALYFAFAKFGKEMAEPTSPETSTTHTAAEENYSSSFPNTPKSLGGSKEE
jgi:hypothetical protein